MWDNGSIRRIHNKCVSYLSLLVLSDPNGILPTYWCLLLIEADITNIMRGLMILYTSFCFIKCLQTCDKLGRLIVNFGYYITAN